MATQKTPPTNTKKELVVIGKTTYHYFRNWVKDILRDGKVEGFRFVKDEVGFNGTLQVDKKHEDKAKKVLATYREKNLDVVEMWWD